MTEEPSQNPPQKSTEVKVVHSQYYAIRRTRAYRKQLEFLYEFSKDHDVKASMEAVGIDANRLSNWLKTPSFQKMRDQVLGWHEDAQKLSEVYIKHILYEVLEGKRDLTKGQCKALDVASRMFCMDRRQGFNPFGDASGFEFKAKQNLDIKPVEPVLPSEQIGYEEKNQPAH